jgi:hypothetical protein
MPEKNVKAILPYGFRLAAAWQCAMRLQLA